MNNTVKISAVVLLSAMVGAWFYLKSPKSTPKTLADYPAGKIFRDCEACPEMVVIPESSSFMMGQTEATQSDDLLSKLMNESDTSRQPLHAVSIGRFALGRMEVTHKQWEAIMGKNPNSPKECGYDCPVENVSWLGIQEYIKLLNAKSGHVYRLPSEAEWEYAATAGSAEKGPFYDASLASDYVWHELNSESKIHAIGGKKANAFKLHDMQGNVWEWVEDCFHPNYDGAPVDGSAWVEYRASLKICEGGLRVVRGGSSISPLKTPRDRGSAINIHHGADLGFRVARVLP